MSAENKESVPTTALEEAPVEIEPTIMPVAAPVGESTSVAKVEEAPIETPVSVKDSEIVMRDAKKSESVPADGVDASASTIEGSKPIEGGEPVKESDVVASGSEKKDTEPHGAAGFLAKLGKSFNPKSVNKKTTGTGTAVAKPPSDKAPEVPSKVEEPTNASVSSSTPVAAVAAEPAKAPVVEDLKGANIEFKNHGGFLGGGWKQRYVHFGDAAYNETQLAIYTGVQKFAGFAGLSEKTKQELVWNNLAHAEQTGAGLLIIAKVKQLDFPLNIVNLADVEDVKHVGNEFIVKTSKGATYEFKTLRASDAAKWTEAIKSKIEPSKAMQANLIETEGYKAALEKFKSPRPGPTPAKTPEAVTSDEEAGEAVPRTKSPWRRSSAVLLGAFKNPESPKSTPAATEAAPAAKGEAADSVPGTSASESTAPEPIAPLPVSESAAAESSVPVETAAAEAARKDKRRSFGGFGLGKKKEEVKPKSSTSGDESPAVVAETSEAPVATETAPKETSAPVPEESTPGSAVSPSSESGPGLAKEKRRTSFFGGFGSKTPKGAKDKALPAAPVTNDEQPTEAAAVEPSGANEPIVEPTSQEEAAKESTSESKSADAAATTPKREGLGRKLTEKFKTLRSKSPSGSKSAKVADEAPKIDTPIEETPAAAATVERTAGASSATEAPLTTTEAKPVEEVEQLGHKSPAVVSAQA